MQHFFLEVLTKGIQNECEYSLVIALAENPKISNEKEYHKAK